MPSYRNFWFENSKGEICKLADKNKKYFLYSPTGLGFEKDVETLKLGDSEKIISTKKKIPNPSGVLLFYGDLDKGYEDYNQLLLFLQKEPIKFYYQPSNTNEPYYIDCIVKKISKDEYKEDNTLRCNIDIKGLSLWKKSSEDGKGKEVIITNTYDSSKGKYYTLTRPYSYRGLKLSDIKINNLGASSVGFEFEVNGYSENAELRAYKDGFLYGVIKFNGNFDVIRVKSVDGEQLIYLEKDGQPVDNAILYQSFEPLSDGVARTFFKLKIGETKFMFNCDNFDEFDGVVIFRWNETYI